MSKRFAQQVQEQGISKTEMNQKIMQRGCYGVSEEWGRNLETVIKYAQDELGLNDPPLFGQDGHKDSNTMRHEIMLEMYSFCKELEEQNAKLRLALAERDAEDRKREAIKHLDYSNVLNEVRTLRHDFRTRPMNLCKE